MRSFSFEPLADDFRGRLPSFSKLSLLLPFLDPLFLLLAHRAGGLGGEGTFTGLYTSLSKTRLGLVGLFSSVVLAELPSLMSPSLVSLFVSFRLFGEPSSCVLPSVFFPGVDILVVAWDEGKDGGIANK
jgi:hypothetical protein